MKLCGVGTLALFLATSLGACATNQVPKLDMVLDAPNARWHPLLLEMVLESEWRLLHTNEDEQIITAAQPMTGDDTMERRRRWEFRYHRDRLNIRTRIETRGSHDRGWRSSNLVAEEYDYSDEFAVRARIKHLAGSRRYVAAPSRFAVR